MRLTPPLTALAFIASTAAHADPFQTGLAELDVPNDAGRQLEGYLWYPTDAAEGAQEYHGNAVWTGITAAADAPIADGTFPLVVLSHGMYGNAMNQSWLASALAEQGYIVAAISHPGTSTWLRDADDARMLWERPKDVSRVIDHLTGDPMIATQIDETRIYMGGHSLGGFTAALLAGARFEADQLEAICADDPGDLICGIFKGWDVAQTVQDIAQMEADLSDPRISKVAVFDLGGTQTLTSESLGTIEASLMVMGAPKGDHDINLDIESRAFAAMMPSGGTYLEPASLSHFDFLGVCKPDALAILQEEEPDDMFVCFDGTSERAADHAMILDAALAFFAQDE